MIVLVQPRAYPVRFQEFFASHQMDLGHEPDMISAIDEEWYSILVVDGQRALAHAIAPRPIRGTGLYDVDPFIGYGGLLANTDDQGFLSEALAAYSKACKSLGVIAELIRFDPFLLNHLSFIDQPELDVIPAKRVIAVTCEADFDLQMSHFSRSRRKALRKGLGDFHGRPLDKSTEIDLFRELYERSLRRVGADERWLFSDRFYAAIVESSLFEIPSVWSGDHLVAAGLLGHHPTGSHGLLWAKSDVYFAGASERLIYEATRNAALRGQRRLMLGGGNTPADDDPLLRSKAQYAKEAMPFFIGTMVHDRSNFDTLQAQTIELQPKLKSKKYFLKHRLISSSA